MKLPTKLEAVPWIACCALILALAGCSSLDRELARARNLKHIRHDRSPDKTDWGVGVGHTFARDLAYDDPQLIEWIFRQHRNLEKERTLFRRTP